LLSLAAGDKGREYLFSVTLSPSLSYREREMIVLRFMDNPG